jgi:hypothetical protein
MIDSFQLLFKSITEVFFSLLPLVIIFIVFQFISLKLSRKSVINIFLGFIFSFVGLSLFMHGINLGFIDNGQIIGKSLGTFNNHIFLIIVGFILGLLVTLAEPAVQVLNNEVEKASGGYVNKRAILVFLCLGVGLSVSLSLIRIIANWPIWYLLLPLYVLAFIMTKYVSPTFTAIAFDAGGVVTGPMIATFLLALTLGVSSVIDNSNPLVDGFGMISIVAIVPIITILMLGILYNKGSRRGGKEQ